MAKCVCFIVTITSKTVQKDCKLKVNSRIHKNLLRFGDNLIGSEDPHAVEGSLRLVLGRQLASDDAVLLQSPFALHFHKV